VTGEVLKHGVEQGNSGTKSVGKKEVIKNRPVFKGTTKGESQRRHYWPGEEWAKNVAGSRMRSWKGENVLRGTQIKNTSPQGVEKTERGEPSKGRSVRDEGDSAGWSLKANAIRKGDAKESVRERKELSKKGEERKKNKTSEEGKNER